MDNGKALAVRDIAAVMESVIIHGDLDKLSPGERVTYYNGLCRSLGMNPNSRPFEYLRLSNKLTLYARKDATDQLRRIYGISIVGLERETDSDGIYTVWATARTPQGRTDVDLGAVSVASLKGEFLANAKMKAITKAKRRVTLSICGLGMLDESEVESIPGAQVVAAADAEAEVMPERAYTCENCGEPIEAYVTKTHTWTPAEIAAKSMQELGGELCRECAMREKAAKAHLAATQPIPEQPVQEAAF